MNEETVVSIEVAATVPLETVAETESVVVVDYTPVIVDATNTLANVFLCGVLMIVGFLSAFKFWEVKLK